MEIVADRECHLVSDAYRLPVADTVPWTARGATQGHATLADGVRLLQALDRPRCVGTHQYRPGQARAYTAGARSTTECGGA